MGKRYYDTWHKNAAGITVATSKTFTDSRKKALQHAAADAAYLNKKAKRPDEIIKFVICEGKRIEIS